MALAESVGLEEPGVCHAMEGLLDDDTLHGPQQVTVVYRPERVAVPLGEAGDLLRHTVSKVCQVWGGAAWPLIPLDQNGHPARPYNRILEGAAIDHLLGLHPFDFPFLEDAKLEGGIDETGRNWQLALALLEYKPTPNLPVVEVVELDRGDPWRDIYTVCLGALPARPSEALLRAGRLRESITFEDFVEVRRLNIAGGLADLLQRMSFDSPTTPRTMSMVHLSPTKLVGVGYARWATLRGLHGSSQDDGSRVVVVCRPESVEDVTLLWNIRGAHGDYRPFPLGIPVQEVNPQTLGQLSSASSANLHGGARNRIYLTSASLSEEELQSLIAPYDMQEAVVVPYESALTIGHGGGWVREEVVNWSEGLALITPLPLDSHSELFATRAFGDVARTYFDIYLTNSPLPIAEDVRFIGNGFTFRAGSATSWGVASNRAEVKEIRWPTRLDLAQSIGARRGLEITESEPGAACRHALEGLGHIAWIGNLAHAPLLALLETMAARQGFNWFKERLRTAGLSTTNSEAVAPSVDQLPDKSFHDFKRALGNNETATKYWLLWAEKARLITKGFTLACDSCGGKQWIPVSAFVPPLRCRSCTRVMETPFGERPNIDFKYRLAEPLRRIYDQDAMGHLLAMRYLGLLIGTGGRGSLIGLHPGMEVRRQGSNQVAGEADVLLLTKTADFVPIEVKRSASGVTSQEVAKLDALCDLLKAPWSAVAACQYNRDAEQDLSAFQTPAKRASYSRVALTYDAMLDPTPVWLMSRDPFEWSPLSDEEIASREATFVGHLVEQRGQPLSLWQSELLRNPDDRQLR